MQGERARRVGEEAEKETGAGAELKSLGELLRWLVHVQSLYVIYLIY